jgi:hypothetical protein
MTQGHRGPDGDWSSDRQAGEYWRNGDRWCAITPRFDHFVDVTTWKVYRTRRSDDYSFAVDLRESGPAERLARLPRARRVEGSVTLALLLRYWKVGVIAVLVIAVVGFCHARDNALAERGAAQERAHVADSTLKVIAADRKRVDTLWRHDSVASRATPIA